MRFTSASVLGVSWYWCGLLRGWPPGASRPAGRARAGASAGGGTQPLVGTSEEASVPSRLDMIGHLRIVTVGLPSTRVDMDSADFIAAIVVFAMIATLGAHTMGLLYVL